MIKKTMNNHLILGFVLLLFSMANAQEPNDCVNAVTVCGNGNFMSNATGSGNFFEVDACSGFEHNSLWLKVDVVQAGTLGFDLIPVDPTITVDYDFWVYGPNKVCSNLGTPIRCATTNPNEANLPNNQTGINGSTTLTQTGPGANGNGYVYWLNVNPGESYYIVIDRPVGDGGFEIQWTGTATEGAGAFPSPPEVNEIDDIKQCSSNSNVGIFDLIGLKSSINNDPNNTIEYYENLANAVDGVDPLPGIYANTSNPQTIYAKVKSGDTDCYSLIDFDLVVTEIPDATISVSSNAICEGEEVMFTITGTPGATVHYNFDGGATQELLLDATGTTTITQSPTADTDFNLENAQILNDAGDVVCSQNITDSETVTVSSITPPTLTSNSPICEGEDAELQFSGNPNDIIDYTIDAGATQTLTLDATGNFTLTLSGLTTDTIINITSITIAAPPNCTLTLDIDETIAVSSMPVISSPAPLLACNDGTNPNVATFDLESQTDIITNSTANLSVTYYETQALAETGDPTDALASPYTSTSANQTIYVRVENPSGCVAYTSFDLEVIGAPIANNATPLKSCDANNAGLGIFDLTNASAEIIAGNTQAVTVSYYLLQNDAEVGTPEIPDPTSFQNTTPYNQTIYARVDSDATDCYTIIELELEIFDAPTLAPLSSFEICDEPGNDGVSEFDLNSQTSILIGGATNVSVTYHESQTDANNGANALASPYTNTSSTQTIYVRAENDLNPDCYATTTFDLVVKALPIAIAPTPLEVCDDGTADGITSIDLSLKNSEISGNNPNYAVSYHLTLVDANADANQLSIPYTNTSNGQIIFVRVEDNTTGCYDTTSLELTVEQAPVANTPTPLENCDPDSDGFSLFDLSTKNNEITGGDSTLTISYHETIADANNNLNPITNLYNNIVQNSQTIYARVESSTIATDCSTIIPLVLIANPTPQLGTAPTALEICDDSSADGIGLFDLSSKTDEVLQNLADPSQFSVTYYANEANANAGTNEIVNITNFTNTTAFNQTIWIRVETNTTGCYKLTTLELIVNAIPVLTTPAPLELCDNNNPGDEMEAFSLENASDEILNGQTGISLSYYETQIDADNATNAITSPYTNTVNAQTIFVRAINNETGCVNTTTLLLRVNPIPSPTTPTDLEACDADNDGFASFNLNDRSSAIIGGELDTEVSYHETITDAQSGENPITSPYTNVVMTQQTIYVRLTNTETNCYNASETLTIRALPSPEVPGTIDNYILCDSNSDGNAQFDLTTKSNEIIGAQTGMVITYHLTQADALSGNNAISAPGNYTNTSNPQTIYVRLANNNNACVATGEFMIMVDLPPVAVLPTPLEICDDETADQIATFNLTTKNDEITGGEGSWSVSYYETNADAQAQENSINATAYTNTSINGAAANPQTVYAVVTSTDTGCIDFTTLTLRVLPNPTPTEVLPELILCDDVNPGDMEEAFDLTTYETLLLNGEDNVTPTYHESFYDAQNGSNAINSPTTYTNTSSPQIIYVRVTNDITGCYTLVDFNISVNPLPEASVVSDFIACELNTDGFTSFDLTTKNSEALNDLDPSAFTVTYHTTQQDADELVNVLVNPYTNTSNPQQIFVAITNNQTGCSISTVSFNLEVQEAAEANSNLIDILYEICDDQMDTDNNPSNNSAQFDLTPVSNASELDAESIQAQVLDGQDPANYSISYYQSEADAELGSDPLPFLYENIVNPQIIWSRVDTDIPDANGNDSSICYAVAPLTLQVNPLPVFDLDENYTLCVNTNGTEVIDTPILDTGLSNADYSFIWFFNGTEIPLATQSSYTATESGSYSVTVIDITGSIQTMCDSSDSTEVILSAPPIVAATVTTDAFADTHIIEVTAEGIGIYEYSLDGGPWQDEPVFSNVSLGDHVVHARDKNGCGQATDEVTVFDYPHFFTPNGDGYNDLWNISSLENQSKASIQIFDRFGKLLKQITPNSEGWDGTFNGSPMPTNDYWFIIEYNEPNTSNAKEFKAHFTLKR